MTMVRLPRSSDMPKGAYQDGNPLYAAYADFLRLNERTPVRLFDLRQSKPYELNPFTAFNINRVVRGMKRKYKYIEDPTRLIDGSREDVWFDMQGKPGGDCEDWAITTFDLLYDEGVDPRCMSLGMGATDSGGWHVVLVIDTAAGTYVHDVAHKGKLVPWDKCSLKYLTRKIRGIQGAEVYAPALQLRD